VWVRLHDGLTADQLLAAERVAVAPGEGFGPSGAGWARLSLAVGDAEIELAAERLARAFSAVVA
jgi:aspartate/methionine/tyrosine aminotransferase